ncbi:MAG TPA: thioredoxin family protein [Terriglobales bacterium]|nr:thioredoxin family protein [Terriglobales bacterium]
MTIATMEKTSARVVSAAEWLAARKKLLAKEKEFTRLRDELSRERRQMPWEKVEKNYVFEGPRGKETLSELFRTRSQLIIYHFMFGPGWKEGCPSCSFLADSFDAAAVHLAQRDTSFAVISRATLAEIQAFQTRMGWHFPWLSSHGTDFNRHFQVSVSRQEIEGGKTEYNYEPSSFPSEERPGLSVFCRKDGEIFHTYSTYARGLDILLPTYNFLDLTPKGRDEEGLPWPMAWVRHHDRYDDPNAMDAKTLISQRKKP